MWAVATSSGQLERKTQLSGRPNNIAVSRDGRHVFVAIVTPPGAVDVIDASTLGVVKTIPVKGPAHNVYVTPYGKSVVVGSVVGKSITVIDEKTLQPNWHIAVDEGVRHLPLNAARMDRLRVCLYSYRISMDLRSSISRPGGFGVIQSRAPDLIEPPCWTPRQVVHLWMGLLAILLVTSLRFA